MLTDYPTTPLLSLKRRLRRGFRATPPPPIARDE
jgi:hypothetical protein